MKGAVLFGLNPEMVVMRKSQHTYGIGVLKPFVRGNHPRGKYRELFDGATIIDIVTSMTLVLVSGDQ